MDYGDLATTPTAPSRSHSTLAGWYKDAGLTQVWTFATDTVTDNITLYAKWTCDSNYHEATNGQSCVKDEKTVTFDANG